MSVKVTFLIIVILTSSASKYVTGIYTSNYYVTFYDMDYNNVPYTTEYAVKLTNQLVTGLSPITPTLTNISSITIIITSSSPSPTTLCTDYDNSKLLLISSYIYYINQLVTGVSPISYSTSTPNTPSSMTTNSMSPSPTTLCTDCNNSKLLLISSYIYYINQLFTGVSPIPYSTSTPNTPSSMTTNSMTPSPTTLCTDYDNSKLLLISSYIYYINQLVTGVSSISYSTSTPNTPSSMTTNSMSPSPTTLCTDCDNSKLLLIL